MSLDAGTRFGPYEIVAPIGAGGMGEVYKARDTRLRRTVAVKVSAEQFGERFKGEARAIAALNHPHICTLHDVGPNFLVMEYIDGTPAKGPMSVAQVLRVGAEIADALDAAHREGIVHRDLKPSNVLLAKSGVKLLDFGLAKMRASHAPASSSSFLGATPSDAQTVTQPETVEGSLIGTLPYMAPEQLQGQDADPRSDIYALGCVLYELLVGRRAFAASGNASIIASVLKDDPPSVLQSLPSVPAALDRVIRKCLAKDPDDRWQSARDLRDELLWIGSGEAQTPVAISKPRRIAWLAVVAIVLAGAIALSLALRPHSPVATPRPVRFPLPIPIDVEWASVSPDGEKVLFLRTVAGKRQYSIYRFASAQVSPVPHADGARNTYWYPDSRAIGLFEGNHLRKIDVDSGRATTLADFAYPIAATQNSAWTSTGLLVWGPVIRLIPSDGGEAVPVTQSVPPDSMHMSPSLLPDGRRFLFLAGRTGGAPGELRIGTLDGGQARTVMKSDSVVSYAEPGYLLYLKGDNLIAHRFDSDRGKLVGSPHGLLERVGRSTNYLSSVSVSQNGVLVYRHGTRYRQSRLTWFDRSGSQLGHLGDVGSYSNPALSPDGNRVAVDVRDPNVNTRDIWIFDVRTGGRTRLTFDDGDDFDAVWSPDGSKIAWSGRRKGYIDLYVRDSSGAGQEQLLFSSAADKGAESWSSDGRYLSFAHRAPQSGTSGDIYLLPINGGGPAAFRATPHNEQTSAFSPDSQFLAYSTGESGRQEIVVQSLSPNGGRLQISSRGGEEPKWRRDGRELYYRSGDDVLTAVDIHRTNNSTSTGTPRRLFRLPPSQRRRNEYVATGDGQRFLVIVPEAETPQPMMALLNWPLLLDNAGDGK